MGKETNGEDMRQRGMQESQEPGKRAKWGEKGDRKKDGEITKLGDEKAETHAGRSGRWGDNKSGRQ